MATMHTGSPDIVNELLNKGKAVSDKDFRVIVDIAASNLRVPLTGIKGYLALLADGNFGKLTIEQKDIISKLEEATSNLIVDLHNIVKLEKIRDSQPIPPSENKVAPMHKVLYFEDNEMLRDMYGTKFLASGFAFAGYESPTEDPVSIVLREKPDLILMDGIMPQLDGIAAAKALKADERTAAIPILGLDNIGGEYAEGAKKAGMIDYLLKAHFMPSEVVNRVRQVLRLPIPPLKKIPPPSESWHGSSVQQILERAPRKPKWWQRWFRT